MQHTLSVGDASGGMARAAALGGRGQAPRRVDVEAGVRGDADLVATVGQHPVDLGPVVVGPVDAVALGLERQVGAVGRPGGVLVVGGVVGELLLVAPVGAHDEDVPVAGAVGGEGDAVAA